MQQLIQKTKFMLEAKAYRSIGLSGGVANNQYLRHAFDKIAENYNIPFWGSSAQHSGDNAGMIAFAAFVDADGGCKDRPKQALKIAPALRLTE